ncbi:sugar ABC transporter ATP-binding protein [Amycolatopsis pithecellobii]|uniref:sugar ABC transporter ATP-binding protein n=1 Tax=Amycolatopsis pithecellobii TaxID=664692 RepID=UPI00140873F1|nr:sugar ABC transporter ATP-binding protein [Amycolatopsis pithecellobii]
MVVNGLSKTFAALRALDDVSFTVGRGEIVAVVGQNGSGKSTLVKVLAGVHEPDPGSSVRLRGRELAAGGGSLAPDGLHFIHQDLGLVPTLNTIENLDLTPGPNRRPKLLPFNRAAERRDARRLIERFGTSFDVDLPISGLSPEQRTIVAIARAMNDWAGPDEVLVLDEPTAALEGQEVEQLFTAVRRAANNGAGVIFISHRLDEVINLAHRVVALRDGRVVADVSTSDLDHRRLIRVIAGRDVKGAVCVGDVRGGVAIAVDHLAGGTVRDVSLAVHEGEVVGIYGLLGSGREQLGQLIYGTLRRTTGRISVAGRDLRRGDPRDAMASGVAFVPSDRHRDGAVMTLSMRENLTLPELAPLTSKLGAVRSRAEGREAHHWASRIQLSPAEPERALQLFSGGNQQKVVLAARLRTRPRVLILDEPTQGVDVAAKSALYDLVGNAAQDGASVLVSSSDTEELVQICNRVLVMRDGRVTAEVDREHLSEELLVAESLGLTQAPPSDAKVLKLRGEHDARDCS